MKDGPVTVAQLPEFDEVIDVRTPAEFAEDHVPGAINCPVMDNEERARVGTLYKQVSAFEARKVGAAIAARHIAEHIETLFMDRPKKWRPLIYCWRGGQRSGSMVTVFRQVGWSAGQLAGGYKAYRKSVIEDLISLPKQYQYRVVGGPTGSAKSRILEAMAARGEQVLDLEALAAHKGSVLGDLPDQPQPGQKGFDSQLRMALLALDPARPVYVEAESRKIGRIQLPETLVEAIRAAPCVRIEASLSARVRYLRRDYPYLIENGEQLKLLLARLHALHSREQLAHWSACIDAGDWDTLVTELLEKHYDALYRRSQTSNFAGYSGALALKSHNLDAAGIEQLAAALPALSWPTLLS